MSEQKSKFPEFSEVVDMANKLFKDVKTSVCEIVEEYKAKRGEDSQVEPAKADASVNVTPDAVKKERKPKPEKSAVDATQTGVADTTTVKDASFSHTDAEVPFAEANKRYVEEPSESDISSKTATDKNEEDKNK